MNSKDKITIRPTYFKYLFITHSSGMKAIARRLGLLPPPPLVASKPRCTDRVISATS